MQADPVPNPHDTDALPKALRSASAPEGAEAVVRARTCVGCAERVEPRAEPDLLRVVFGPGSVVVVDAKGTSFGRGAHLHARPACVEGAAVRGLARSFKSKIEGVAIDGVIAPLTADALGRAIASALDRRIEGLLASGVRARAVAFGSDAASGACERGEAKLVLVATDAAAAADLGPVRAAIAAGHGCAWGSKVSLGALVAPGKKREVGVVAVLDSRIAQALLVAVRARNAALSQAPVAARGRRKGAESQQPDAPPGAPVPSNHAERGA